MAELTIPDELTVETMPDDPRECCRWIRETFGGDEHEFPLNTAPAALCDLVEMMDIALYADAGLEEIAALGRKPLTVLAYLAKDTIREWDKQLSDISKIARHGVGDYREMDREYLVLPSRDIASSQSIAQRVAVSRMSFVSQIGLRNSR